MDEAKEIISGWLTQEKIPELEFGAIYTARVVEMRDIGLMVTLYPNMPPALLHNSQLDSRKVSFNSTPLYVIQIEKNISFVLICSYLNGSLL